MGFFRKPMRAGSGKEPIARANPNQILVRIAPLNYTCIEKRPGGRINIVRSYISLSKSSVGPDIYVLTIRVKSDNKEIVHDFTYRTRERAVAALAEEFNVHPGTLR